MDEFTIEIRKAKDGKGFVMDFEPNKANMRRFIISSALEVGEWAERLTNEYFNL